MSFETTLADPPEQMGAEPFPDIDGFLDDAAAGRVLGERYRLENLLGRGGMGAVFAATDLQTDQRVAVKCLRRSRHGDDHISRRMLREARAVAAIGHPGIVELLDVGKDELGQWFVVFELLKGLDIDQVLKADEVLTLGDVWRVGVEVLDALDTAHRAGVVHRDLKPANLFLHETGDNGEWTVKLLDFGIAKQQDLSDETKLTTTGIVVGTPQYMSPEQARGKSLDGRSDIWSVACLLFRLLTGHVPFEEDNFADLMARMLTEKPPRLHDLYPELPEEFRVAVDGALQRKPERRWESAGAMRDVLLGGLTMQDAQNGSRPPWATSQVPPPLLLDSTAKVIQSSRPHPLAAEPTIETRAPRSMARMAAAVLLAIASGLGGYALVIAFRSEPPEVVASPAPEAPNEVVEDIEPEVPVRSIAVVDPTLAEPLVEQLVDPTVDETAVDETPRSNSSMRVRMTRPSMEAMAETMTGAQPAMMVPMQGVSMMFSVQRDWDG